MRRLLRVGPGKMTADTRQVLAALEDLPIPTPWDLGGFISRLEEQRRRPIRVEPYPVEAKPREHLCGMWIRSEEADFIFYEPSTSQYHRQQIILHEIGHIVLQHHAPTPSATTSSATMAQWMPDIDPATLIHVLGRTTFDSSQESQAELFASLVLLQQGTTVKGSDPFSVLDRRRRTGTSAAAGPAT